MLTALAVGAIHVPLGDVIAVIGRRLGLIEGSQVSLRDDQIVWQLRLPRVLGAAATGAGLAMSGVVLQSLTRNALADPYLLGVSSGATVGAVLVIVLGFAVAGLGGTAMLTVAAFAGAIAALLAVLALATDPTGGLPPARTILAGVAVAQVCAAFTAFVVIVSDQPNAAHRVLAWTLGSFGGVRWSTAVFLVIVTTVVAVALMFMASDLDAFAFGEHAADSLGVNVVLVRWILLILTSLLVAALVANVGAIGFIGLVVPHIARLAIGPLHLRLLPATAVIGAILAVGADLIARTIVEGTEVPVGAVTALVGAPVFAILLRRQR
ncbi:FecCD family ABC transporter permease [Aeromicrobium choanae]